MEEFENTTVRYAELLRLTLMPDVWNSRAKPCCSDRISLRSAHPTVLAPTITQKSARRKSMCRRHLTDRDCADSIGKLERTASSSVTNSAISGAGSDSPSLNGLAPRRVRIHSRRDRRILQTRPCRTQYSYEA